MRHGFLVLTCTAGGLLLGGGTSPPIPAAGQPHENSLGMRFVPVPGTNVLFSIWETRVRDFEVFASATGHREEGKVWTWIDGKRGNYDGYKFTAPVGSYAANRHGLYDLGGNAAEWCEDKYLLGGNQHVLRGASFRRGGGSADVLSSHRGRAESGPDNRYAYHGFRVVLAVGSAR